MAKRKSGSGKSGSKNAKGATSTAKHAPVRDDRSLATKISWGALLAMVFLVPVVISNWTFLTKLGIPVTLPISYDQFDIIKVVTQRVLVLVALAAWGWDILMRGGKVRHTPVNWLILAFLGWVSVSTVLSIHPATALFGKYRRFEGLLSFLTYAAAYFLVMQHLDGPKRVKQLANALFFAGLVVAGYGALQSVGVDFLAWGNLPFEQNRSFSTYGNPDLLGGFLMFSLFVSLGLALAEKNLVWRGVYWFGVLLNAYVTISAFTRSAWVGAFVGMIFFVIIAIIQKVDWKTEDWVFSGGAVAAVLAIIARSLKSPNEVMNFASRVTSIFKFGEGSAKTRFEIWSAALRAIEDRPVFGFGPDTFRLLFPRYKPIEYVRDAGYLSVADNVHNYPLQLASGIGVPGALMFYGIFGWAAVRSGSLVFKRADDASRMVYAGFWVACAAYITHLMFGLSVTGTSLLLWVALAVVLAPTARTVDVKAPSWGVAPAAILLIVAALGVGLNFNYLRADNYYMRARIGSRGQERVENARVAASINPYNDMYQAEVALAYMDTAIASLEGAFNQQNSGGDPTALLAQSSADLRSAEQQLLKVIDFIPAEYDNYVFLANLYNVGGEYFDPAMYEKAKDIAKRGIAVEEFGPAIRFQYARALYETGDRQEAIKQLEYCVEMDPAFADAVTLIAEYKAGAVEATPGAGL